MKHRFKRIFRFYDYKGATLHTRFLGLPILKKNNVLTLSLFGLPLAQRKMFLTTTPLENRGGGG